AVAAQQLIVAFAVVLLVARVAKEKLCVVVEIEIRANEPAVLSETCIGQTRAEDIRRDTEKTGDGGVVIETVRRPERADTPRVQVEQKAVLARAVSQQRIAAG